jgi:cell division protein FtsL
VTGLLWFDTVVITGAGPIINAKTWQTKWFWYILSVAMTVMAIKQIVSVTQTYQLREKIVDIQVRIV